MSFARFVTVPASFLRDGIQNASFPVILAGDGAVFEAGYLYIHELYIIQRRSVGTVKDVAGIICAWLNHLDALGLDWCAPSVPTFIAWSRHGGGAMDLPRLRRRSHVVFAFYEHLDRCAWGGIEISNFVSELTAPVLDTVVARGLKIRRTLRLGFGRVARQAALRPTPSAAQVDQIAEAALSVGGSFKDVRNWLLVRAAYETNLRAEGLAALQVDHLDGLLTGEGLLGEAESIADFKLGDARRARVRRGIDNLEGMGRRYLILDRLREKGKERSVRFPIRLVRQMVAYAWDERRAFATRSNRNCGRCFWISTKTFGPLSRGAIADVLKDAFDRAGVRGSGHRLRAAHCVELFREYVKEARQNAGGKFDAEAILDRVAQIMGHTRPDTLKPYLHTVMLEDLIETDERMS